MTREEVLEMLDDEENTDRWCVACDWLEKATGEETGNDQYSEESIREAVETEDVSRLRKSY